MTASASAVAQGAGSNMIVQHGWVTAQREQLEQLCDGGVADLTQTYQVNVEWLSSYLASARDHLSIKAENEPLTPAVQSQPQLQATSASKRLREKEQNAEQQSHIGDVHLAKSHAGGPLAKRTRTSGQELQKAHSDGIEDNDASLPRMASDEHHEATAVNLTPPTTQAESPTEEVVKTGLISNSDSNDAASVSPVAVHISSIASRQDSPSLVELDEPHKDADAWLHGEKTSTAKMAKSPTTTKNALRMGAISAPISVGVDKLTQAGGDVNMAAASSQQDDSDMADVPSVSADASTSSVSSVQTPDSNHSVLLKATPSQPLFTQFASLSSVISNKQSAARRELATELRESLNISQTGQAFSHTPSKLPPATAAAPSFKPLGISFAKGRCATRESTNVERQSPAASVPTPSVAPNRLSSRESSDAIQQQERIKAFFSSSTQLLKQRLNSLRPVSLAPSRESTERESVPGNDDLSEAPIAAPISIAEDEQAYSQSTKTVQPTPMIADVASVPTAVASVSVPVTPSRIPRFGGSTAPNTPRVRGSSISNGARTHHAQPMLGGINEEEEEGAIQPPLLRPVQAPLPSAEQQIGRSNDEDDDNDVFQDASDRTPVRPGRQALFTPVTGVAANIRRDLTSAAKMEEVFQDARETLDSPVQTVETQPVTLPLSLTENKPLQMASTKEAPRAKPVIKALLRANAAAAKEQEINARREERRRRIEEARLRNAQEKQQERLGRPATTAQPSHGAQRLRKDEHSSLLSSSYSSAKQQQQQRGPGLFKRTLQKPTSGVTRPGILKRPQERPGTRIAHGIPDPLRSPLPPRPVARLGTDASRLATTSLAGSSRSVAQQASKSKMAMATSAMPAMQTGATKTHPAPSQQHTVRDMTQRANGLASEVDALLDELTSKPSAADNTGKPKARAPVDGEFTSIATVTQTISGELVYDLPEIESEYSDEEEMPKKKKGAVVPAWADAKNLAEQLHRQRRVDPDLIFGKVEPIRMEAIFKSRDQQRFRSRTSSAHWLGTDRLTEEEEEAYRLRMGYRS
ncbi:hypothetical protein THASP1DRAFT_29810 [Thamnocephalis sphaerospora]|uniref:Inner centromere protein ARK-binding domain-containing protein n=1 Tax=Thamnocephalis sphaerospora TaxID=78915 RepID=A0A4P9XQQ0_9FUNG|nr:hypothetical protein THASP1DRAFT_29810 [Thamnocephalis sphaerospora]|eukprot:RKP08377.1 hypothetical protein THASP1DRAFT_29810 [Thamnocephalis sphaerospora]